LVCVGEVYWQNHWQFYAMKMLALLGDATQTGSLLFYVTSLKVSKANVAGIFVVQNC
jgi:hypothetical protein